MKKLFLTLISALAIFTAVPLQACDNDPGCTCNPLYAVEGHDIAPQINSGNIIYFQFGDRGKTVINPWDRLYTYADTPIGGGYILKGVEYEHEILDCGSDACKHPESVNMDTIRGAYIKRPDGGEAGTATFSAVSGGWYMLTKIEKSDGTVLFEQDIVYPDNFPKVESTYLTPASSLDFVPYYAENTLEARLEYRLTNASSESYQTAITVTNPQYYAEKSYIFGRTPLKNITLDNVNLTVRAYFTNGINEYYTPESSFYFKQQKGLK
jgi:hypothetical protein